MSGFNFGDAPCLLGLHVHALIPHVVVVCIQEQHQQHQQPVLSRLVRHPRRREQHQQPAAFHLARPVGRQRRRLRQGLAAFHLARPVGRLRRQLDQLQVGLGLVQHRLRRERRQQPVLSRLVVHLRLQRQREPRRQLEQAASRSVRARVRRRVQHQQRVGYSVL